MGFFSDLKEDLSQAVSELVMDESEKAVEKAVPEPEVSIEDISIEDISVPDISEEASTADAPEPGFTSDLFGTLPDGSGEEEVISMPETSEELGRMLDSLYPDETGEKEEAALVVEKATETAGEMEADASGSVEEEEAWEEEAEETAETWEEADAAEEMEAEAYDEAEA